MDKLQLINTNSEMAEQNFISMKMEKFRSKELTQETEEPFITTSKDIEFAIALFSKAIICKDRESFTKMMLELFKLLNMKMEAKSESTCF